MTTTFRACPGFYRSTPAGLRCDACGQPARGDKCAGDRCGRTLGDEQELARQRTAGTPVTPAQSVVLALLRDGWDIIRDREGGRELAGGGYGYNCAAWRGGSVARVSAQALDALVRRGLLVEQRQGFVYHYQLAPTKTAQDGRSPAPTAADLAEAVTEAHEQSQDLQGALRRYAEVLQQVQAGTETHGVLGQHEQAVLDAGGTWSDMRMAALDVARRRD